MNTEVQRPIQDPGTFDCPSDGKPARDFSTRRETMYRVTACQCSFRAFILTVPTSCPIIKGRIVGGRKPASNEQRGRSTLLGRHAEMSHHLAPTRHGRQPRQRPGSANGTHKRRIVIKRGSTSSRRFPCREQGAFLKAHNSRTFGIM